MFILNLNQYLLLIWIIAEYRVWIKVKDELDKSLLNLLIPTHILKGQCVGLGLRTRGPQWVGKHPPTLRGLKGQCVGLGLWTRGPQWVGKHPPTLRGGAWALAPGGTSDHTHILSFSSPTYFVVYIAHQVPTNSKLNNHIPVPQGLHQIIGRPYPKK